MKKWICLMIIVLGIFMNGHFSYAEEDYMTDSGEEREVSDGEAMTDSGEVEDVDSDGGDFVEDSGNVEDISRD